jgi:hypothetical protein
MELETEAVARLQQKQKQWCAVATETKAAAAET